MNILTAIIEPERGCYPYYCRYRGSDEGGKKNSRKRVLPGNLFAASYTLFAFKRNPRLIFYPIADLAGHVFMVNGYFHVNGVTDTGKIGTDGIRRLTVLHGLNHITVLT